MQRKIDRESISKMLIKIERVFQKCKERKREYFEINFVP